VAKLTEKLPEEVLWLLLTGELPSPAELQDLQADLRARAHVPDYVWAVLKAMPADSHPMVMLTTAILVMERESVFRRQYDAGMKKDQYWAATLEDALNIIAVLPAVAAGIYRMRFGKGERIPSNPALDWATDYTHMLGIPDPKGEFGKLMQLYMVLHSDHESGNVSAMTTATVNSALSDLYYSLSAGLDGLAGPLHGLANQECLAWVLDTNKKFGGHPTKEQIKAYAEETLAAGRVVPGYGHAVLRITDPRFDAFLAFGKKYMADDPVFQTVANVFDTVPDILKTIQKIKDPWPNVDAGSGALLYHYGLTEFPYYTVLFSVSRGLGVCSQAVIARGLGLAITRPKSVTTGWIKAQAASPAGV
jgi:citrate synthase